MATMEGKFIEGCAASGTDKAVAKDLWSLMTAAADYSFNKSHAACYALISYRTAYLKANYPAEYMAAVISSVMSTKDKVPFFVNKCARDGHRGAASGRQLLRPRLHRLRQLDPLRTRRGQERRPQRGRDDHRLTRGRGAVRVDLGLLRAGRLSRGQQASDRVPRQVRRAGLHGRLAPRDARGPRRRPGRRSEGTGRLAPRAGIDLRPRRRRGQTPRRFGVRATPPRGAGRGVRAARDAARSRRRRWARSSPRTRLPR